MRERQSLTKEMARRYKRASKRERGQMLRARLLREQVRGPTHRRLRRRGRQPAYGPELIAPLAPEPEPLDDEARAALVEEFLASPHAPAVGEARSIVYHCLDARRDYGDGDALQAAGIDLTDQQAIDAWVAEFNARPRHERDAIMGASPFLDDSDPAT